MVELALKSQLMDRTDWRRMLKGPPEPAELTERAKGLRALCEQALEAAGEDQGVEPPKAIGVDQREFDYPVLEYPTKVRSINAEKQPRIQARLLGIKGRYLIFGCGVINMRKYAGYEAALL